MWRSLQVLLAACVLLGSTTQPAFPDPGSNPKAVKGLGKPVKAETLANQRGGEEVVNLLDVKAKVYDNNAINTISGNNIISDNAFSHASGVPIAIQNSGNNVVIQNSMILNLQMK
jgi:parallel beta-helix repeat protein